MSALAYLSAVACLVALPSAACAPSAKPTGAGPIFSTTSTAPSTAGGRRPLNDHLPVEVTKAPVVARVPPEVKLRLTLDLPIKDGAALAKAVRDVSDPKSPSYRHFLSPDQFGEQFGASAADYRAVVDWARANHLAATTHANRLVLEVVGSVADIETALDVHLNYATRPDGTWFRAPDREPTLALSVPIQHLENLDDYVVQVHSGLASSGTGPKVGGGSPTVTAIDIRNAYLGGGAGLTGAGQNVGVINHYDPTPTPSGTCSPACAGGTFCRTKGCPPVQKCEPPGQCFLQSDINSYISSYGSSQGITPPAVQTALFDSHCPGGATPGGELTLDISMVTAMAPGAQVVVAAGLGGLQYFADAPQGLIGPQYVGQITSSFSWSPLTSSDVQALAQFAVQGQSFFTYSGDGGAYSAKYGAENFFLASGPAQTILSSTPPADLPFTLGDLPITIVGGTYLFMKAGAYDHEQGWTGGGGGILTPSIDRGVALPPYQSTLFAGAPPNGASSQYRNSPDVSAVADNVLVISNGQPSSENGTSASSPLWAGFMALLNQTYLAASSCPQVGLNGFGFANPVLYGAASAFRDVTSGTNPTSHKVKCTQECPSNGQCPATGTAACSCYTAGAGYDLVTGLGAPQLGLFNALKSTLPPPVCGCGSAWCVRTQACYAAGSNACPVIGSCTPVVVDGKEYNGSCCDLHTSHICFDEPSGPTCVPVGQPCSSLTHGGPNLPNK